MKRNSFLYIVFIDIIIFVLVICVFYIPLVRIIPKTPDFEVGTTWVCSNPEIEMVCNETGPFTGYMVINDEKVDLIIHTTSHRMDFYVKYRNDTKEIWLLKGNYKISKGNIIIRNIDYIDNDNVLDVKKIKLINQSNSKA